MPVTNSVMTFFQGNDFKQAGEWEQHQKPQQCLYLLSSSCSVRKQYRDRELSCVKFDHWIGLNWISVINGNKNNTLYSTMSNEIHANVQP